MEKLELKLVRLNEDRFTFTANGNVDDLATMLVAGLTYRPELLKKTFKGILEKVYGDEK